MLVVPDTMMSFVSLSAYTVGIYFRVAKGMSNPNGRCIICQQALNDSFSGAVDVFIYLLMQRDLRRVLFSVVWRQPSTNEGSLVQAFPAINGR
jgi:hypothetical protein